MVEEMHGDWFAMDRTAPATNKHVKKVWHEIYSTITNGQNCFFSPTRRNYQQLSQGKWFYKTHIIPRLDGMVGTP